MQRVRNFFSYGFHTPTLLKSILAVNSRWLARVLHTPSHLLTPQTLSTTSGDMRPFLDLIQQGFQSNFQYPSMQTTDDSTISSGSTSQSTIQRDFVSGFPVETPVQNTVDPSGRQTVTIGQLSPDISAQSTVPLLFPHPLLHTTNPPTYDPLRLLSSLEKECPRLVSTDEQAIRTFIASYKDYRRAGGVHCAYTINDLISIEVRQTFRMSSVQDPYALVSDEDWLSFLTLDYRNWRLYQHSHCIMQR